MLFLTLHYNYSCCSWMFKCTISQRSRTIFFLLRCKITVIHLNSCREKLTVEWYSWLISDFLKKSSKTWIQFICMIHKKYIYFLALTSRWMISRFSVVFITSLCEMYTASQTFSRTGIYHACITAPPSHNRVLVLRGNLALCVITMN